MNAPATKPLHILLATLGPPFAGDSPERQALGGSETALVQVARALAAAGHQVAVACPCPAPGDYGGVVYHHVDQLPRLAAQTAPDVLVVSRFHHLLDLPWRAGVRVLWAHDLLSRPAELAPRLGGLDRCLVLSDYHADLWRQALPTVAPLLARTINGLDLALLDQASAGTTRRPRRVVYASRPERGLEYLLEHIWPKLRRRFPDLKLELCGYVDPATVPPELARLVARVARLAADTPGVTDRGRLAKGDYYRLLASAAAVLYPCVFPEISCLVALEAQALGTPVVTSDAFALSETVRPAAFRAPGTPRDPGYAAGFLARASRVLDDPAWAAAQAAPARETVRREHAWAAVAAGWVELFQQVLDAKRAAPPAAVGSPERPLLSLCMIVRDEEKRLAACLESAKPWVDEMVVVDTGSTDRTVEIAQAAGARVHHLDWPGDYAVARNFSLDQARGRWVLVLDADEVLDQASAAGLRASLARAQGDGFLVERLNLAAGARTRDLLPRVLANDPAVRYRWPVHETPTFRRPPERLPLLIHHHGYDLTPEEAAGKQRRRLELLQAWAGREPGNLVARTYLARQMLVFRGMEDQALGLALDCLRQAPQLEREDLPWLMQAVLAALERQGRWADLASFAQMAAGMFPLWPDPLYHQGLAARQAGDWRALARLAQEFLDLQLRWLTDPHAYPHRTNGTLDRVAEVLEWWRQAAGELADSDLAQAAQTRTDRLRSLARPEGGA